MSRTCLVQVYFEEDVEGFIENALGGSRTRGGPVGTQKGRIWEGTPEDSGNMPLAKVSVEEMNGLANAAGPNSGGASNRVICCNRVTASNGGASGWIGRGSSGEGVRAGLVGRCCGGERVRWASPPASSVPSNGMSSSSGRDTNSQSMSADETGRLVRTGNALDIAGHAASGFDEKGCGMLWWTGTTNSPNRSNGRRGCDRVLEGGRNYWE